MTEIDEILHRFDLQADEILADIEGFRAKIDAQLIAEKGEEWFEAHRSELDADWEGVTTLMGL
jgi:hypothetical protein